MTISLKNNLVIAMEYVSKRIPVTWPLQQFIASNPWWDLIDQPLTVVGQSMAHTAGTKATMSLPEYWDLYQSKKISDRAIHQAVTEFIADGSKASQIAERDDLAVNTLQQVLYEFMTQSELYNTVRSPDAKDVLSPEKMGILLSSQVRGNGDDRLLVEIQAECLRWLSAYFNPTSFYQAISLDTENLGVDKPKEKYPFFTFWLMVMSNDRKWSSFLLLYEDNLEHFVSSLLSRLSVPEESMNDYLLAIAWQLKGWCGYIKWQKTYPNNPYINRPIELIEVIAIWLAHEVFWLQNNREKLAKFSPHYQLADQNNLDAIVKRAWLDHINQVAAKLDDAMVKYLENLSAHVVSWLWQRAYEISYHEPLYQKLLERSDYLLRTDKQKKRAADCNHQSQSPKAQWVFCIDVRSEGIRRHLEKVANYETFGFAGFFGFAYQLRNQAKQVATMQCPALIDPSLVVDMMTAPKTFFANATGPAGMAIQQSKRGLLAPFVLYEMIGLWYIPALIVKNYGKYLPRWLTSLWSKKKVEKSVTLNLEKFDLATMTTLAKGLLQGMGLTDQFAEFVVICGHSATTENNPYQASLDCGACGGNGGITNAMVAAHVLNNPSVRDALAKEGIAIPDKTCFIAACHDTTTDEIQWCDQLSDLTEEQQSRLQSVQSDAVQAGRLLQKERLSALPGDQNVLSRSRHWAELIPEWGLANNAAMIIASRSVTEGLNLGRRVFLHSYDVDSDPEGDILESIFLGPVIVAHWINSQYYFSSVDPDHYSSGNKAIHNVLPDVGVIEGNQSDLKYGLPLQSLFYQGQRIHEPIRLCVFVDAYQEKINRLLAKNPVLNDLVEGQWLLIKSLRTG